MHFNHEFFKIHIENKYKKVKALILENLDINKVFFLLDTKY